MIQHYQTYTITIAAGAQYRLEYWARFLTLLSLSSGSAVDVLIGGGRKASLDKGVSIELPEKEVFSYLIFYNDTEAAITLKIGLSMGRVYDNRVVVSGTIPVNPAGDIIETPAAIAAVAATPGYIEADSDQWEIIIQNTGNYDLYIGDEYVDESTKRGILLQPGDNLILATSARVYYEASGGNTTISYLRNKAS